MRGTLELRHDKENGVYILVKPTEVEILKQGIADDMLSDFCQDALEKGLEIEELEWGYLIKVATDPHLLQEGENK